MDALWGRDGLLWNADGKAQERNTARSHFRGPQPAGNRDDEVTT